MQRFLVGVALSLLTVAGVAELSAVSPGTVSAGHLKIGELAELTEGGRVKLVGFAWDGPARRFGNEFAATGLATPAGGDRSFSIAAEGPSSLCAGLQQIRAEKRTLDSGRLTFRGAAGPVKALTLARITVETVDCSKSPYLAELRAETIADAAPGGKAKNRKKARGKTSRG